MDSNYMNDYFAQPDVCKEYINAVSDVGLWNTEKKIFNKYINKEANILDIGCGAGRVSVGLYQDEYKHLFGIDICEQLIEKARNIVKERNYNIIYKCNNATQIEFENDFFDAVIFSFNGLVLIPGRENRKRVLQEVNRVLKKQGIFIFTTDDRRIRKEYNWFWKLELDKWCKGEQDKRIEDYGDYIDSVSEGNIYFYFPTLEEVAEVLNKTGFTIVEHFKLNSNNETDRVLDFYRGKYNSDEKINCRFWITKKR